MKLALPEGVTRNLAMTLLKTKKNSPHIFFAAGVVGVVGSAVLACRATLKLEDTLEEIHAEVEEANLTAEIEHYNDSDRHRKMAGIGVKGTLKVARLYAPAVGLGAVSIACLTGSHIQLTKRNAALSAALTATMKAFDEYRARVRAEIGEEKEFRLYRGIEEITTTDEEGKKHKELVINPSGRSELAVCFDESNPNWTKNAEINKARVMAAEKFANHQLYAKGHVFLNDVYKDLGFPETPMGQILGWVLNDEGDNCVDFGLWEGHAKDFIDGTERSVWLDFNVDGVIYDKI